MINLSVLSVVVACICSLVPTAWCWHRGRALARLADDPALPERLAAHRQRSAQITVVAFVMLAALAPSHAAWAVPLLLFGKAVAWYPARRRIFGERWSLAGYLSFFTRLSLAGLGFWVLLACTPLLMMWTGRSGRAVGLASFIVLVAWNAFHSRVFCWLMRVRPVADSALQSRFDAIVAKTAVGRVRVGCAGPDDAAMANAVALPSATRPTIVMAQSLLARLTHDQSAAIFAHEVAHLEHYTRVRLRQAFLVAAVLSAVAGLAVPVTTGLAPAVAPTIAWTWPVVVVAAMLLRARRSQAMELASDRRAVELTGDGEALVSALITLHLIGRVPRQRPEDFERSASHPSLARRIQAIRGVSGTAAPQLEQPAAFRTASPDTLVLFDRDRVRLLHGAVPAPTAPPNADDTADPQRVAGSLTAGGTEHAFAYSDLRELRVAAQGVGHPELVLVDRESRRYTVPIPAADLPRLREVLAVVDTRVPIAAATSRWTPTARRGVVSFVMLLALATWSSLGPIVVALLALARPASALVGATGASVAAAGVLVFTAASPSFPSRPEGLVVALAGVLVMVLSWRMRRGSDACSADESVPRPLVLVVAATAALAWTAPLLTAGSGVLRLSSAMRGATSAVALTVALAVLAERSMLRRRRALAAVLTVIAFVPVLVGSRWFTSAFLHDPMLGKAPVLARGDERVVPIGKFDVEAFVETVRLSPHGLRVAVAPPPPDEEEDSTTRFTVLGHDHAPISYDALDLDFVNDDRVVLLTRADGRLHVTTRALSGTAGGREEWRVSVPDLNMPRLSIAHADGRWRVVGMTDVSHAVRLEGRVDTPDVRETRWAMPRDGSAGMMSALVSAGPQALALEQRYHSIYEQGWLPWRMRMLSASLLGSETSWSVDSRMFALSGTGARLLGRSQAPVACAEPIGDHTTIACVAQDGFTSVVSLIDPRQGVVVPVGSWRDRLSSPSFAHDGTLVVSSSRGSVAIDLQTRTLLTPPDSPRVLGIARVEGYMAALSYPPANRNRVAAGVDATNMATAPRPGIRVFRIERTR